MLRALLAYLAYCAPMLLWMAGIEARGDPSVLLSVWFNLQWSVPALLGLLAFLSWRPAAPWQVGFTTLSGAWMVGFLTTLFGLAPSWLFDVTAEASSSHEYWIGQTGDWDSYGDDLVSDIAVTIAVHTLRVVCSALIWASLGCLLLRKIFGVVDENRTGPETKHVDEVPGYAFRGHVAMLAPLAFLLAVFIAEFSRNLHQQIADYATEGPSLFAIAVTERLAFVPGASITLVCLAFGLTAMPFVVRSALVPARGPSGFGGPFILLLALCGMSAWVVLWPNLQLLLGGSQNGGALLVTLAVICLFLVIPSLVVWILYWPTARRALVLSSAQDPDRRPRYLGSRSGGPPSNSGTVDAARRTSALNYLQLSVMMIVALMLLFRPRLREQFVSLVHPDAGFLFMADVVFWVSCALALLWPLVHRATKGGGRTRAAAAGHSGTALGTARTNVMLDGAVAARSRRQAATQLLSSGILGGAAVLALLATSMLLYEPGWSPWTSTWRTSSLSDAQANAAALADTELVIIGAILTVVLCAPLAHLGDRTIGWLMLVFGALGILAIGLIALPRLQIVFQELQRPEFVGLYALAATGATIVGVVFLIEGIGFLSGARAAMALGLPTRPTLARWVDALRHALGAPAYLSILRKDRAILTLEFLAAALLTSALPLAAYSALGATLEVGREYAPISPVDFRPQLSENESNDGLAETALAFMAVQLLLAVILTPIGLLLGRRARRRASARYQDVQLWDDRAPVLYLRPFKQDSHRLTRDGRSALYWLLPKVGDADTLDELILERASQHGPVLAIGRPGEPLPPLGAARRYCPALGEEWKNVVEALGEAAQKIVICLDETEGVRWEYDLIIRRGWADKTLFLANPLASAPERRRVVESIASSLGLEELGEVPRTASNSSPIAAGLDPATKGFVVLHARKPGRMAYACGLNWGFGSQT